MLFLKCKFSIVHKAFSFLESKNYRESITHLCKDPSLLRAFLGTQTSLKNVAANLTIESKETDFLKDHYKINPRK